MALTKMQKRATTGMFALAFVGCQSKDDRKKTFLEFEDVFGVTPVLRRKKIM